MSFKIKFLKDIQKKYYLSYFDNGVLASKEKLFSVKKNDILKSESVATLIGINNSKIFNLFIKNKKNRLYLNLKPNVDFEFVNKEFKKKSFEFNSIGMKNRNPMFFNTNSSPIPINFNEPKIKIGHPLTKIFV